MITAQRIALAVAAATAVGVLVPATAEATVPSKFANCTNLTHYYRHGVGKLGARDHVAAGATPVTTWLRSTVIYNQAMRYNKGLDRDHDYIACERK